MRASLLVAVLLLGSCTVTVPSSAPTPEIPPAPAGASLHEPEPAGPPRLAAAPLRQVQPELAKRLNAVLSDPEHLVDARLGIAVLNERGYPVFLHGADAALLPASTLKSVTAAAALLALGPDFRFRTTLLASDSGQDGVIHGDLVLRGGGDPVLATPTFGELAYPDRPRTPLEVLADSVVEAGIRTVSGTVIGDPAHFDDDPLAPGWLPRYLDDRDTGLVSGLTVDRGLEVTYHEDGRVIGVVSEDPAATAATRLLELLEERDVHVLGGATSGPSGHQAHHQIATVESAPLVDLLRYGIRWSDNPLADATFRTIGVEIGPTSTWAGSAEAVRTVLDHLPLEWSSVRLADGSGLSRDARLSADFLARLDLAMYRSPFAETWADLHATAGRSGTLRRRLAGSLADGRLQGKTGTLDDVRALSGSVTGRDGRRYHLAVIANALAPEDRDRVRQLVDAIVLTLAEDALDCTRPDDEPDAPPVCPP